MTAPDAAGIETALAAGLAAHAHPGEILVGLGDAWMICGCGERFDLEVVDGIVRNPNGLWFTHVAAALLPVVTQAQAEAWDAGWTAAKEVLDLEGAKVWAHTVMPDGYEGNPYRARAEIGGA